MAHPTGLLTTLLVIWGLSSGVDGKRWWPYWVTGCGLGFLILLRMGDALAIGVPAILWSVVHLGTTLRRDLRIRSRLVRKVNRTPDSKSRETHHRLSFGDLLRSSCIRLLVKYFLVAVICLTSISFLAYYNWRLTGDPMTSTYIAYSPHLRMGFGPEVGVEWGVGHDRLKAITNLRTNLGELYRYWFSAPRADGSGWEAFIGRSYALWLFAPLSLVFITFDRKKVNLLLLAMMIGTGTVYFCYFHPGVSYGPRFYYGLLGPLTLLTARGCWCSTAVARRFLGKVGLARDTWGRRFASSAVAVMVCIPALMPSSFRASDRLLRSFRGYNGMNRRAIQAVEARNLKNAVVIVKSDKMWFPYGNVFWSMSPHLDGPVVFARDRGLHNVPKPGNRPLDNRLLLDLYPDREYYRLVGTRLVPYDLRKQER